MFLDHYTKEGTRGGNTLDLSFSNEKIIEHLRVGEYFGLSDHQFIIFDLKLG